MCRHLGGRALQTVRLLQRGGGGGGGRGGGQLLPKLGKLKDVTRQRRGDILGARGAVKVQGKRYVFVLVQVRVSVRLYSIGMQNALVD
jgi:hypothetical protein